eukprot:scaffold266043_cov18-Tisochrysis_lutea.AAC.1
MESFSLKLFVTATCIQVIQGVPSHKNIRGSVARNGTAQLADAEQQAGARVVEIQELRMDLAKAMAEAKDLGLSNGHLSRRKEELDLQGWIAARTEHCVALKTGLRI